MNPPGTLHRQRSAVRVCSECYALTESGKDRCPACGTNVRRRDAWERVAVMLVVGWLVGALVFQLVR
jgi:rRNA maturation endonuclease Nob1